MSLSTDAIPSANTQRLAAETPAADVDVHHLTAFADGDDEPSFKDFLDIINPLQHIPIVSTIYRELTGDEPGALSRIAGGALYGGVIGLALGATDAAVHDSTGKDIGENLWAFVTGEDDDADGATKMAEDSATPDQATLASPQQPIGSDQTAERRKHNSLHQKLHEHFAFESADGKADADLTRAFSHRHQHDIHNADPSD